MGVQVGNQCFTDQQSAENYLFSQATPLLTEAGVLSPVFIKGQWIFKGEIIHLSLPECSQTSNFAEGQLLGWALTLVIIVAWKFKIMQRIL